MSSSHRSSDPQPPAGDGSGAAWGAIAGGLVGAIAGSFFNRWLQGGLALAALGWIIGALIDRTRR